jgi:O-antigen/teichoic acid export membrane protein
VGALGTFVMGVIFVAVFHWGVYGLVGAMIVANLMTNALYFVFMPWLPSLMASMTSLRRHFSYGRWFLGVSVTTYANVSVDRLAVGHALSTTQLGYYEYAGNIPLQVVTKISQAFNGVLFSAFSSLQADPGAIRELLRKFYRYNALLSFPVLVGIALVAQDFVAVAYGEKWMPIVPTIRLFCLYAVTQLYTQPFHSICNGVGLQHLPFRWMLIYLPINLVLIFAGIQLGQLNGVVLVRTAMPIFVACTLGVQVMRHVKVPWSLLVWATAPAIVGCLAMSAVVLVVNRVHVPGDSNLPHLLLAVGAGFAAYLLTLFTFWRSELVALRQFLTGMRGR